MTKVDAGLFEVRVGPLDPDMYVYREIETTELRDSTGGNILVCSSDRINRRAGAYMPTIYRDACDTLNYSGKSRASSGTPGIERKTGRLIRSARPNVSKSSSTSPLRLRRI
jgi:hypothetical protein